MIFELKCKIQEIADRSNFNVELMGVDKDHIHVLVDYEPNILIVQIVRKLKQETQHYMWVIIKKNYQKYIGKKNTCFGLRAILYVVLEKVQVMIQYGSIFKTKGDHSYA